VTPVPLEDPIRAELFGIERLEQHADSLATAQRVAAGDAPKRALLPRVDDNGRVLREANRQIAEAVRTKQWITPAAEWLIDNFFIVDEQLREIRDDLPVGFYRELPSLADGPHAGYPRVYGIAWAFVAHTDSRFDPDSLRRFVLAYQRVEPLSIGELWAVTISLRVVLVENLRRVADAIIRGRNARQEADALANDVLGPDGHGVQSLAAMTSRGDNPQLVAAFAVELVQRLRDQDPAVTPALAWLQHALAAQGMTADAAALAEHHRQAAMTVTVRNIITSMRLMSELDWTVFFESVSLVDETLRAGSDFAAMDFASRDTYRHAIEALSRGSSHTELDVARESLERASRSPEPEPEPEQERGGVRAPNAEDVPDHRRRDPGYYLVGGGRRQFERELGFHPSVGLRLRRAFKDAATLGYLGTALVLTAALLSGELFAASSAHLLLPGLIVLGVLAVVPASDVAIALLNRFVTVVVAPEVLPQLEWPLGIPAEFRTMVVVPTMLTGIADVDEQVERLEVHFLANADGDVRFALVTDWNDSTTEHAPTDEDILAAARGGIARLNRSYGPATDGGDRFFVFHRKRLWSASEGTWMGWERKRGKLHEINRLLRGATDTTFLPENGKAPLAPQGVRYVVTLDADTRLPIDAVRRLAGAMAHPLNWPRLDAETRQVVEGYAILQPRVTSPLPGREGSIFQRLSSGSSGIDPYSSAVSDVYQDLFGEGSYSGKGIYDVDVFEAALAGRVPDNCLLSHDLFEGLFARAGLVTDVELFETAPSNYLTASARQHRWARGDWQLLPFVLRERLSPVGRWKILDNLRRTLSMPTAFLALLGGWIWPGASPVVWTVFILLAVAIPPLLPAFAGIWPIAPGSSKRSHLRAAGHDFRSAFNQMSLTLTMLAHQAWLMSDAIARTLVRLFVTRRRLLEWQTSTFAASQIPSTLAGYYRRMGGGVLLAVVAAGAVLWERPGATAVALPILMLWGLAPVIARQISRPGRAASTAPLMSDERRALRLVARRTWSFFTTFVTADSHALPPDNFQETPQPVVAQRTSPTNIGMYLLSVVSARDFGWVGMLEMVDRIESTLQSVNALEHHRGHLYNWYATQDYRPLEPKYVSSVDSGNLAGALLTLANASEEMTGRTVMSEDALSGIHDAALLLREAVLSSGGGRNVALPETVLLDRAIDVVFTVLVGRPRTLTDWAARLAELETATRTVADRTRNAGDDPSATQWTSVQTAAEELRDAVETHVRDVDALMPWARLRIDEVAVPVVARLLHPASLADMPGAYAAALLALHVAREKLADDGAATPARLRDLDVLAQSLEHAADAATSLLQRLAKLATDAREMVRVMEFDFLFDRTRMLFAIGYRMSDGSLDVGRYDLLASEARLLSFVAIAKGDVPVGHWFRLGRLLTPVGKGSVLMSWAGSMFEYLMPSLIMRTPVGSLIDQTCRLVVQRQMTYAAERGIPWGMSESGYFARDLEMTYQYSNFGVPGLGLRRGLADDIVVAPYATALAAMFEPREAAHNFAALTGAGASGRYGFYESLDYTPKRLPTGTPVEVVQMYMAHHQGMAIVAIGNVLHNGAMRTRFHAEPMVRASELLLQERTPRDVAVARERPDAAMADVRELVPAHTRKFSSPHGATPRTQLLSNGRYAVMITAAGSGYSRWRDLAITRWREDATSDDTGSYIYLRDAATGEHWSAGFQPSGETPTSYEVSFAEDGAEFVRRDGAITTRLEVIVSSEDDAEVRRVSITNEGLRTREIEVTSYAEIVLAPAAADTAHPAFSNLSVLTESIAKRDTLLATRRKRSASDDELWLAHVLAVEGETIGDLQWETDRLQFIGRGRTLRAPHALTDGKELSNTVGAVLDPIVSLRRRVRVRPGKTVHATFSTLVGTDRDAVLDLADKYHDVTTFERVSTLAWTQAQLQMHHLGIEPDEAHLFQTLGGSVLFVDRAMRAAPLVLARRTEGVSALWAQGISGDLPIVLVEIDDANDVGIVRQLLRAHAYWRLKRLAVDLVILNDRAPSYVQDLQTLIETLVRTSTSLRRPEGYELHGRVFTLRADRITEAQRNVLESVARVELSSRRGPLAEQIARAARADVNPPPTVRPHASSSPPTVAPGIRRPKPELEFSNGLGGFDADGTEYVTILRGGQWTPAPWVNVLANSAFGCLVSEAGSGCTWSINSQENRITEWSNDPVSDRPSEMFYIRDDVSGTLWSPTPLPIREPDGEYVIRHGHGYSRYSRDAHEISSELLQFVPEEDPLKISRLTLTNHSSRARHLTVTGYLGWVLGASRSGSAPYVMTEIDDTTGAMFATNSWNRDFDTRVAFADLGGAQTSWTGDRTEFLGRNGALADPAALRRRDRLSGRTGATRDPCCALQTTVEIPAGGQVTLVLFLGQAESREQARTLIARYRTDDLDVRLKAVTDGWATLLGTVQVQTPDRALDIMLNGWLLYQTLACRVWARAAFYQSSGAFGFRDQLQDVMALAVSRSDLTREQLLKAASRQFVQGDVQHWWHEPVGRGVRTRFSDDLLWLPYVASHYLDVTGDQALLDTQVPFLEGAVLAPEQLVSYFEPRVAGESATLFEHCARAIDRSLDVGAHGLPLIGTGDWNDGMNRVGVEGRGESVWLAWFLHTVLDTWAPIAAARGETKRAGEWATHAKVILEGIEKAGWDGNWYRRAYFDDGTPLGVAGSDACAIDSIVQSWSVLSGAGDPDRARRAMSELDARLVRRDDRLMLLLTPPFDQTALEPGYIKGYVPGVRENGAQYTHAAAWAVIAFAMLGDGDKAGELFGMLNPIAHTATPNDVQRYRVEPYVVAGDVCSEAPNAGRGGWTWYTGAAGWLYRTGIEWMLGIRVQGATLRIDPCIPSSWPGYTLALQYRATRYEVEIVNPDGVCRGVSSIVLDGIALADSTGVPLVDDQSTHRVRVVLGPTSVSPNTQSAGARAVHAAAP
jgi:cyclic beta-1,2-glucan synthetase